MNKPVCYFVSLPVVAVLLTGISASAATAQGAAAPPATDELKVLVDNDKVLVTEEKLTRGANSASKARPYRVVRALQGGTIQRIYPDGKQEMSNWKTGEVKVFGPTPPYAIKNVGDTDVIFYIVSPK
ncbi:MAG: hypothetical protein WCA85_33875 [Paraburkholderia sp.]|uniref:hypothetical protein n=1 Tax=Paraburkholderia sp. TaxID=1926495 RepID=UPI003C5F42E5